MKNSSGMSLLELLISIAIMIVISISSSQALRNSIRMREKLGDKMNETSKIRDTLRLMEKDINLIYHYRDLEKELLQEVEKQLKKSSTPSQNPNPQSGVPPAVPGMAQPIPQQTQAPPPTGPSPIALRLKSPNRVDPTTHFVGKENEISFTTNNSMRLYADIAQADFVKVGYRLDACKSISKDKSFNRCLYRRESAEVEGDVTKGGAEIALLENIEELKFRYYVSNETEGRPEFASNQDPTKDRIPDAVEVLLKVNIQTKGKKEPTVQTFRAYFPIHFPNNPEGNNNVDQAPLR